MLNTTRPFPTILAFLYCFFKALAFFQSAVFASLYHALRETSESAYFGISKNSRKVLKAIIRMRQIYTIYRDISQFGIYKILKDFLCCQVFRLLNFGSSDPFHFEFVFLERKTPLEKRQGFKISGRSKIYLIIIFLVIMSRLPLTKLYK